MLISRITHTSGEAMTEFNGFGLEGVLNKAAGLVWIRISDALPG